MKKSRTPFTLIALAATSFLLGGCVKEVLIAGTEIQFGASTFWENDLGTRTEYSHKLTGSGTSRKERINWVANTDRIRIYSPQASTGNNNHISDYFIESVTNSGATSSANIKPVGGNGLKWAGTDPHYFYAMYPAEGTEWNYGNKTVGQSGEYAPTIDSETDNRAKITGKVPASQTVYWNSSQSEWEPNMNYAYMYAKAHVSNGSNGAISLAFEPLVTTFEFRLKTPASGGMTSNLTKVELSSASTNLSGTFTATLSSSGDPTISEGSDARNTITIDLGTGVQLPTSGDGYKLTILTLPILQKDLTLTLYFGETKRILKLQDNGSFIQVAARKKIYITNMDVPGSITYFYDMASVSNVTTTGAAVLYNSAGSVTIRTEKDQTDGYGEAYTTKNTPWQAYFGTTEPTKGSAVPSGFSTSPANWLNVSGTSGNGNNNTMSFTLAGQQDLSGVGVNWDATENTEAKTQRTSLQSNNRGTVDLSKLNFIDGGTYSTAETANCYIVDGYGTFYIPLIYGNSTGQQGGYPNCSGKTISSDYIINDTNLPSGNYSAVVLWQDTKANFEIVTSATYYGSRPDATVCAYNTAYIGFTITKERIKPGNVVIALKKGDTIVWSWHIWVRGGTRLSTINVLHQQGSTYSYAWTTESFLSEPLGWTPPISYNGTTTSTRTQWVAIVSTETNKVIGSFKIEQTGGTYIGATYTGSGFSQTYYQWGRKDPFLPSNGASNPSSSSANKVYTGRGISSGNPNSSSDAYATNAWTIKNPTAMYTGSFILLNTQWDSGMSSVGLERPVTKTIYDPSPRGFKLARAWAFTGFTYDGGAQVTAANIYGSWQAWSGRTPSGYNFTTNHTQGSYGIYFGATGLRQPGNDTYDVGYAGYCWTACPDTPSGTAYGLGFNKNPAVYPTSWRTDEGNRYVQSNAFPIRPVTD